MDIVLDEKDHYALLQIAEDASIDEVKTAYRRLALENHPDLVADPWATERMQRINAAYGILIDPTKRAAYDLERAALFREALEAFERDPDDVQESEDNRHKKELVDTQEIQVSQEELEKRRSWARNQLKLIFRIFLITFALFAWALVTGQVNFALLAFLLVISLQIILSIMMRVRNVSTPEGASNE
jgi:curved DNA-binding protein CbpA